MSDVHANGRSVLHKGDGLTQVSGPPDVCKTPSPGGPVPVPYPNIAKNADLAGGAKTVKIEGNPIAHANSNLSTSTGDEAGTAGGGLISSKIRGKLTFGTSSVDVKVEGKGVVRFLEVTHHNGNTFNTVINANGDVAYGDDPIDQEDCAICGESKAKHKITPKDEIAEMVGELRAALKDPGRAFMKEFVTKPGSTTALKKGVMIGVLSCQCKQHKPFAGLAGPEYKDGQYKRSADAFRDIAKNLGFLPVVDTPPPPPRTGFRPPARGGGFGALTWQPLPQLPQIGEWNQALMRSEAAQAKYGHGNPALTCAAPKMIQECLARGHKPGTMIEMWVSMKPGSAVTIAAVYGLVADPSTVPQTISKQLIMRRGFGDGEAVPSCVTCQVICTTMLCRTGQPPCP